MSEKRSPLLERPVMRERFRTELRSRVMYADAVVRFANALDRLRDADNEDKRNAAQDLADAAQAKHRAVLDSVKDKLPAKDQPEIQRVIDDEQERTSPTNPERRGQDGSGGRRPSSAPPKPTPRK